MSTKAITIGLLTSLSLLAAGCGNTQQGSSPSLVTIVSMEAASGAKPDTFGLFLASDVTTIVKVGDVSTPTIFDDSGRVTMSLALKNGGTSGLTLTPTPLNVVTFTHYRVVFHRTDGHNIEGVDVPFSFDSGLTFSVPLNGTVQIPFELVRHTAKEEAPLKALSFSGAIINTIADVTFYGQDQAGNSVSVTGSLAVNFGDFGDPSS